MLGSWEDEFLQQRLQNKKRWIKVAAGGCYSRLGYIMAVKKRKARSAQLDAAPVSRLQTARCGETQSCRRRRRRRVESGCMEEDVGVLVWEKGKVTM